MDLEFTEHVRQYFHFFDPQVKTQLKCSIFQETFPYQLIASLGLCHCLVTALTTLSHHDLFTCHSSPLDFELLEIIN